MLFLKSFLDRFLLDFGWVWEAFWPFLAALGALWGDFLASFLNEKISIFRPALLEAPELDFEGILEGLGWILEGFWDHFFEILDLLAEDILELISNLKLQLFLLNFKMSSCNFEWFLLPIGELVEPILNFNKSSTMDQNQLQAFATVKRTEKDLMFAKPKPGKGKTKTKYNKVNANISVFSKRYPLFPPGRLPRWAARRNSCSLHWQL